MSQENVEGFKRGMEAINRGDIEALLEDSTPTLSGTTSSNVMLRGPSDDVPGHDAARELFRDLFDAFAVTQSEYTEIRDLGEHLVATGRLRTRGQESGAETVSPIGTLLVEYKDGTATRVRTFLDQSEALEAAGLSEPNGWRQRDAAV